MNFKSGIIAGLIAGTLAVAGGIVAASAEVDPDIRFTSVRYNPWGADTAANVNQEWFVLKNYGSSVADLSELNYVVEDAQGTEFHFTSHPVILAPGQSVTVHSGQGTDSPGHTYWDLGYHVWGNSADSATLYQGDPDNGGFREDRVRWSRDTIVAS